MVIVLSGIVGHRCNQNRTDSLITCSSTYIQDSWETTRRT